MGEEVAMVASGFEIRIAGTGSCLPERVVGNAAIGSLAGIDPDWPEERLGIRERRIAGRGQETSDLAAAAAAAAIEDAGIDPATIDLLVVATATPDRQAPSTACIVQHKLGLPPLAAFDVAAVCSGFLFGLVVARQFVRTGEARSAVVVGADTFSRITDWRHRDACFFGDGAGAVVVDRSTDADALFVAEVHGHGQGIDHFTVRPGERTFVMDGKGVWQSATEAVPRHIRRVLDRAGLTPDDVDVVVPHQPSIHLLKEIARQSQIDFGRVRTSMDRYANTAGATIPVMLDEARRDGGIAAGDVVLFAAAGAGMTSGAAVYRWH